MVSRRQVGLAARGAGTGARLPRRPHEHLPRGSALPIDGGSLDLDGLEAVAAGRPVVLAQAARDAVRPRGASWTRRSRAGRSSTASPPASATSPTCASPSTGCASSSSTCSAPTPPAWGRRSPRRRRAPSLLLRANVLAKGFSGVRLETLELLVELLNRRVHPVVPSQGSVGRERGPRAPRPPRPGPGRRGRGVFEGRGVSRRRGAARAPGSRPLVLEPKEGLALINGTQLMTAVGGLALAEARRLARIADVVGAMTLDALEGTDIAFDPRIHAARPHPGQAASARNLRRLLAGQRASASPTATAGGCRTPTACAACPRCTARPATRSTTSPAPTSSRSTPPPTTRWSSRRRARSSPAATSTASRWRSRADFLAIAAAELGAISERRTERLVNPSLSGLPAFLAREGGLHSGFMMAHVTAAALVSESKALAHPASVDSIPTSAGKEDHVSMGPTAAWKAARVVANTSRVLAVELLAACEALDFRRPLRSSAALEAVHARVRERVPDPRPRPRPRPRDRGPRGAPPLGGGPRRGRVRLRYAGVDADPLPPAPRALARRRPAPRPRRGPRRPARPRARPAGLAPLRGARRRAHPALRRPRAALAAPASPPPKRAADRSRFRVVPGGKGNGHDHDADEDDEGDKPRWVM